MRILFTFPLVECLLIISLTLTSAFHILPVCDFFIVVHLGHSLSWCFILIFNCWHIFTQFSSLLIYSLSSLTCATFFPHYPAILARCDHPRLLPSWPTGKVIPFFSLPLLWKMGLKEIQLSHCVRRLGFKSRSAVVFCSFRTPSIAFRWPEPITVASACVPVEKTGVGRMDQGRAPGHTTRCHLVKLQVLWLCW